jgi:hypothetical protein
VIRVRVYRCKDSLTRARFRKAIFYCLAKLLPNKKRLDLKITFVDGLNAEEGMAGSCQVCDSPSSHKHSTFEVSIDSALSFEDKLSILSHELTHVKQYAKGELSYNYKNADQAIWKGKYVMEDTYPYEKQPWEIDAAKGELKLLDELLKNKICD